MGFCLCLINADIVSNCTSLQKKISLSGRIVSLGSNAITKSEVNILHGGIKYKAWDKFAF